MEGVRRLVHAAVQQLVDAELLYVASYLVGSAAQEVIGLKRRRTQQKADTDPERENVDNIRTILLLMDGVKKLSLSVMWKYSSRFFSKGAVK